jgi:hypothetical protein
MRTLTRVARETAGSPQQLPTVFPPLAEAGIRPRRATVTMVAATPASLKSMLTLYWIARMGLPCLFFSADTDAYESMKRAAAMVSGKTMDEVERDITAGRQSDYEDMLARLNIRWVFETDPTYTDLELETAAFAEVFGEFPEIVVIDNLMNVVGENENEFASMRDTTKALKRLVRITNASVFVLHHMQETEKDNGRPAARNRLQGKVSQLPEMILSIALSGDELRVAAVKNRFGPGDASAEKYVSIFADPGRCRFYNNRLQKQQGVPA